jgi:transmembrane sensor
MRDTRRPDYHDRIIDEATDWFGRLQDNEVSAEDRDAFAHWLCASPEHVREYLALRSLCSDVSELPLHRSVEDSLDAVRQIRAENVVSLPSAEGMRLDDRSIPGAGARSVTPPSWSRIRSRSRAVRCAAAVASFAILVLGVLWWAHQDPNLATYTTFIGEQKSFLLPDGSVVTLNAVSKLHIRYNERCRDVQLLSGEALFSVAKNARRPFRVLSGDSVIQAVGTRFDVYHRRADTIVTVVEGTVEIHKSTEGTAPGPSTTPEDKNESRKIEARDTSPPVRISRGQRARIVAPDATINVSMLDPAVDTAWRERRLIFESRPLAEAVAEFNLYNATPIEIVDGALKKVQVSGAFYADDPNSFVLFLDEAGIAKSKMESGRTVLLPTRSRP